MHDVTPVIQPFRLATAPDQPVGLAAGTLDGAVALPLVECLTLEHGRCFVDHRLTQTTVGSGLRPVRREPLTSPWPGALQPSASASSGRPTFSTTGCTSSTLARLSLPPR